MPRCLINSQDSSRISRIILISSYHGPMNALDGYLSSVQLLDCQGRVDAVITLLIDGRVRVERPFAAFVLNPLTGHPDVTGVTVPNQVWEAAEELVGHSIPRPFEGPHPQRRHTPSVHGRCDRHHH